MRLFRQARAMRASLPGKQEGVVLFFALIGLVVLLLAATALIRSVDTATIISGNLAFRQAATSSGDGGVERAMVWLNTNIALTANDKLSSGYYSSVGALNLTADTTWQDGVSADAGTDESGNTIRYVIERMCRTPNQAASQGNCIFSDEPPPGSSQRAGELTPVIQFESPVFRVTARVTGPKNTISYIQGFVY